MAQRTDNQTGDAIRILLGAALVLAVYSAGAEMGWWPWAGEDDPPPPAV